MTKLIRIANAALRALATISEDEWLELRPSIIRSTADRSRSFRELELLYEPPCPHRRGLAIHFLGDCPNGLSIVEVTRALATTRQRRYLIYGLDDAVLGVGRSLIGYYAAHLGLAAVYNREVPETVERLRARLPCYLAGTRARLGLPTCPSLPDIEGG